MVSVYLVAPGVDGLTKLTFHGETIIQNTPQVWVAHSQNK